MRRNAGYCGHRHSRRERCSPGRTPPPRKPDAAAHRYRFPPRPALRTLTPAAGPDGVKGIGPCSPSHADDPLRVQKPANDTTRLILIL